MIKSVAISAKLHNRLKVKYGDSLVPRPTSGWSLGTRQAWRLKFNPFLPAITDLTLSCQYTKFQLLILIMATPRQGKELHQLKLKLTKDPRATTAKLPTPTKQHPPVNVATMSTSNQPRAPATKVLKLSDVIVIPAKSPGTPPVSTKTVPTKSASKAPTAGNASQQPSTARPQTLKSPKQQQVTLISPPIVVKSPRKKQTVLVNPQVLPNPQALKQVKQPGASANPIVIKSPQKAQPPGLAAGGEGSTKHKPPPLVLQAEPKHESKKQSKKSSSQSILPTSRVRTIMKTNIKSSTSDGPLNIGQDSVAVISKATVCLTFFYSILLVMCGYLHLQEMFIAELMKGAHKTALESCHKEITYGHLGK